MRRFRYFITVCVLLLPLFGWAAESILGVNLSQADMVTAPGGIATGEVMLVNCGTNTLNFSLEPRGIEVQGYTPGSCVLEPSWVDLSTHPYAVELIFTDAANEVNPPVDLRFVFPFYEEVFTNVTVGKNGLIALGRAETAGSDYAPFPTTNAPPYSIASYWGDLSYVTNSDLPSRIFYLSDSNRFVVMYQNMRNSNYGGAVQNFEVILSESGAVTFHYDGVSGLDTVSRGLQDYANGIAENLWSSMGAASVQLTPKYPAYYFQSITNVTLLYQNFNSSNPFLQNFKVTTNNLGITIYSFPSPVLFFGKSFTKYRVHKDGYISLGKSTNFAEGETCLIAPYKKTGQYDANAMVCHNDGGNNPSNSIIFTWLNMGSSNNCYRAFVYPDGTVSFEYYSITGFPSFAGIQAPEGVYTHPNSVITNIYYGGSYSSTGPRVTYAPNIHRSWLSASPKTGNIAPSRFKKVILTGNSTGLETNTIYWGNVLVTHRAANSADSALVKCPVTMKVKSSGPLVNVTDVRYDPVDSFQADRIGPGDTVALYLTLQNTGKAVASNITAVLGTNSYIFLSGTNTQAYGDLPVDGTAVNSQPYVLNVKTNCPAGATNLTLKIRSNGSVIRTNTVSIRVQPTSALTSASERLVVSVRSGFSTNISLTLSNAGNAALDFQINDSVAASNYTWTANTNGSAVSYSWPMINYWQFWDSLEGMVALNDPDPANGYITAENNGYSDPIALDFRFPFYGGVYDQIVVHAHGFITFSQQNGYITENNVSPPVLFGLGCYLAVDSNAVIVCQKNSDKIIVSYMNMRQPESGGGNDQTFQIILNKNGTIKYQYASLNGTFWPGCKIGVKGGASAYTTASLVRDGDSYLFTNQWGNVGTAYVTNITNRTIQIEPETPNWISYTPYEGTIQTGGRQSITVTCNAAGLAPGTYTAELQVTYPEGTLTIPVVFYVSE